MDKLTVFEVIVKDANITDLEQACTELRKNLEQLGEKKDYLFKTLIFSINRDYYSAREIQLRMNSARTPQELRKSSARTFMNTVIRVLSSVYQNYPTFLSVLVRRDTLF